MENKVNKNKKIVLKVIIMIITLSLIIFMMCIVLFKKDNDTKIDEKQTTTKNITTTTVKKDEFDLSKANEIMENILGSWKYVLTYNDIDVFNDDNYKTFISILNSKINNDIIYNNYDVKSDMARDDKFILFEGKKLFSFSGYEFKNVLETFNNKFSNGKLINDDKLKISYNCKAVNYDNKLKIYITSSDGGCGDGSKMLSNIVEAYKSDGKLYIVVASARQRLDEKTNQDYIDLIDSSRVYVTNMTETEILDKYENQFFKYEFIFDIKGDKYIFNKVDKLK